jgi:hypothetical protein
MNAARHHMPWDAETDALSLARAAMKWRGLPGAFSS